MIRGEGGGNNQPITMMTTHIREDQQQPREAKRTFAASSLFFCSKALILS